MLLILKLGDLLDRLERLELFVNHPGPRSASKPAE
jgi:hypothetical protein